MLKYVVFSITLAFILGCGIWAVVSKEMDERKEQGK